eukprot:5574698-Prymnesium_polylepis.4
MRGLLIVERDHTAQAGAEHPHALELILPDGTALVVMQSPFKAGESSGTLLVDASHAERKVDIRVRPDRDRIVVLAR